MRRGRPSATATMVACARGAAGLDPIAHRLVPRLFRPLAGRPGRASLPLAPLIELMRVRTLAIDAAVVEATRDGTLQLVVLGAGLCARAWRLTSLGGSTVYEVDHPATQAYKRSRLTGLPALARAVRFVPVDFERDDLERSLADAGHDAGAPTTWLWEGVTPYLSPAAIAGTLAAVHGRSCEGSTIVLTYYPPAERRPQALLRAATFGVRLLGEPFRGLMSRDAMHGLLERNGFAVEDDARHRDLAARLGLRSRWPSIDERIVVARVTSRAGAGRS